MKVYHLQKDRSPSWTSMFKPIFFTLIIMIIFVFTIGIIKRQFSNYADESKDIENKFEIISSLLSDIKIASKSSQQYKNNINSIDETDMPSKISKEENIIRNIDESNYTKKESKDNTNDNYYNHSNKAMNNVNLIIKLKEHTENIFKKNVKAISILFILLIIMIFFVLNFNRCIQIEKEIKENEEKSTMLKDFLKNRISGKNSQNDILTSLTAEQKKYFKTIKEINQKISSLKKELAIRKIFLLDFRK